MTNSSKKRVLVLAPHNDDETLGCGASIAKHVKNGDEVFIAILTSIGENHPVMASNKAEIRAETAAAMKILGVPMENVIFGDLPNVMLPDIPMYELNAAVHDVIFQVRPNVMYIPFMNDLHKDHRATVDAAMVAARTVTETGRNIREIYMYETLSETHWNMDHVEGGFLPNVFNDVTGFLKLKSEAVRAYKSQLKFYPDVRSVEAIEALAVFRGAVMGMCEAEAFMLVRCLK